MCVCVKHTSREGTATLQAPTTRRLPMNNSKHHESNGGAHTSNPRKWCCPSTNTHQVERQPSTLWRSSSKSSSSGAPPGCAAPNRRAGFCTHGSLKRDSPMCCTPVLYVIVADNTTKKHMRQ